MVHFTLHLIAWIACAIFWVFVICWTIYGIYSFIKNKYEWWIVGKHEKAAKKREDDKKWERISKEDKISTLEEMKKERITPEEEDAREKTRNRLKKDKKIAVIALCIVGWLILAWIIV